MIDQPTLDIGYIVFGLACFALTFWLWLHADDRIDDDEDLGD